MQLFLCFNIKNNTHVTIIPRIRSLFGRVACIKTVGKSKITEIIIPGISKSLSADAIADALASVQKIQLLLHSDQGISIEPSTLGYVVPERKSVGNTRTYWLYLGHFNNENTPQFF